MRLRGSRLGFAVKLGQRFPGQDHRLRSSVSLRPIFVLRPIFSRWPILPAKTSLPPSFLLWTAFAVISLQSLSGGLLLSWTLLCTFRPKWACLTMLISTTLFDG